MNNAATVIALAMISALRSTSRSVRSASTYFKNFPAVR
jgi:hypothetical protein